MEALKETITNVSELFHTQMAEFHKELQQSKATSDSNSSLAAEFTSFRKFIMSALEMMQKQVEILSRDIDRMEMQRRRKILLLHGVSEGAQEPILETVSSLVIDKLKVAEFSTASISRCHRLGQASSKKARPIIVKFKDPSVRDKVWFSKAKLKGSGVTLSEFLTRTRHTVFLKARQRFGISKCWTRDGMVHVLLPTGSVCQVESLADLDALPGEKEPMPLPKQTTEAVIESTGKPAANRTKRTLKK